MKRIGLLFLSVMLCVGLLAGCGTDDKKPSGVTKVPSVTEAPLSAENLINGIKLDGNMFLRLTMSASIELSYDDEVSSINATFSSSIHSSGAVTRIKGSVVTNTSVTVDGDMEYEVDKEDIEVYIERLEDGSVVTYTYEDDMWFKDEVDLSGSDDFMDNIDLKSVVLRDKTVVYKDVECYVVDALIDISSSDFDVSDFVDVPIDGNIELPVSIYFKASNRSLFAVTCDAESVISGFLDSLSSMLPGMEYKVSEFSLVMDNIDLSYSDKVVIPANVIEDAVDNRFASDDDWYDWEDWDMDF